MKRPTRELMALIQEPPKASPVLHNRAVVFVNTHEAKNLFLAKAEIRTYEGDDGQRAQTYLYGGKYYIWIAGITTDSFKDDFPISPEQLSEDERSGAD